MSRNEGDTWVGLLPVQRVHYGQPVNGLHHFEVLVGDAAHGVCVQHELQRTHSCYSHTDNPLDPPSAYLNMAVAGEVYVGVVAVPLRRRTHLLQKLHRQLKVLRFELPREPPRLRQRPQGMRLKPLQR